jgi:hypothetical protein
MTRRVLTGAAALVFAISGTALAGAFTLHPSGFGEHSYAAWRAHEGQTDSTGNKAQALYFQKFTNLEAFAAGLAVFKGFAGTPVQELTGLEWEHRDDGHCGAGAPRWNVNITSSSTRRFTVFLGCLAAAHTPSVETGWTRDTYSSSAIQAQIASQVAAAVLAECSAESLGDPTAIATCIATEVAATQSGTIRSLLIVFDEGLTFGNPPVPLGVGFVYLDNITVEASGMTHVWTSASDNGQGASSAANELSVAELEALIGDTLEAAVGLPRP